MWGAERHSVADSPGGPRAGSKPDSEAVPDLSAHSGTYTDSPAHRYTDTGSDDSADSYAEAHPRTYPHAHTNSVTDTNRNTHPDSHANGYTHAHGQSHCNPHPDSHTNGYTHAHGQSHCNTYTIANYHSDSYLRTHCHAYKHSHSGTCEPGTLRAPWMGWASSSYGKSRSRAGSPTTRESDSRRRQAGVPALGYQERIHHSRRRGG